MDEETRILIRDTIRETLFDIFAPERSGAPLRRPEPLFRPGVPIEGHDIRRRDIERHDIERLEHAVDRLNVVAAHLTSWAPATCAYNATDIADILRLAKSIDGKT